MNCEQTREAIDSGIQSEWQSEAVYSHLTGCPACQQYETEMASLLSLLSAQPRVKAPANFETQLQARLQTVLTNEEAKLSALLGSLPVVAAPANFEAQLQARLASEEVKVAALVGVLPAVQAPSNFDFRLRARLAHVNATETGRGPLAWLTEFWTQSFSFGQAATALAALALVVAFSMSQFNHKTQPSEHASTSVATVETTQVPETRNVSAPATVASTQIALVRSEQPSKATARFNRPTLPAVSGKAATPVAERQLVASNIGEQTVLSSVTRQEMKVSHNGYAFGQQLAKSYPAPKTETLNVAF